VKRPQVFVRFAALLALVACAAPALAQGVTLRYRWNKGEAVTYRMTMRTSSTITGMPGINEMKVDQTMTQVMKIAVDDVAADGTTTLRETFESVKLEMDGPMGHVVYDTAAPSSLANPMVQSMRQVLGGMVGESITIVQAADGTVRKVEGGTRILEKVTKTMAEDPSTAAAAQGVRSVLSDEALKATMEQSFSKLPAKPVTPADTWEGQLSLGNDSVGKIGGTVRFTLRAIEGSPDAGMARIGVSLALKQEAAPPAGPNGMVMKLGAASGEGEMLFDLAKGRIQRSTMRSDMPSTITMQGPEGSPATMQNKTTTTMTMELVEK
jgi:hypothetical protein